MENAVRTLVINDRRTRGKSDLGWFLTNPVTVFFSLLMLLGFTLVALEMQRELGPEEYGTLAMLTARSCTGPAELKERMAQGAIRVRDRQGVEIRLRQLAVSQAKVGVAGLASAGCVG